MALDVIGPGFGRTGTNSMKIALEHLGYGPCHHMFEIVDDPALLPPWVAAGQGEAVDWPEVFRAFRAQVDWPGARFWRELIAAFPQAKVVLTVRDPQDWYDSIEKTLAQFIAARGQHESAHLNDIADMCVEAIMDPTFGPGGFFDRERAIKAFNAHIAEVKATVPSERLLVFDVREGWAPLCAFLGCDVPDIPFPKTNSSKDYEDDILS